MNNVAIFLVAIVQGGIFSWDGRNNMTELFGLKGLFDILPIEKR